jgi:hypothetical protein
VIPGGARLHAVYGDRVLLERNGGLETLLLPRTAGAGVIPASAAPVQPAVAGRDNSTLLAGLVRMQPVFDRNKLTGYRIFPGGGNRGNTAFAQLGLRAGDLVLAVNGTPLDDSGRALEVLQTLSSAGSATVTVSRNGQTQELNLNLASLNVDAVEGTEAGAAGVQGPAPPAPTPGAAGFRSRLPPPGPPPGSTGSPSGAAVAPGTVTPSGAVAPPVPPSDPPGEAAPPAAPIGGRAQDLSHQPALSWGGDPLPSRVAQTPTAGSDPAPARRCKHRTLSDMVRTLSTPPNRRCTSGDTV